VGWNGVVDGHKFVANVSVLPAVDEFLPGSDWLFENKAKWDFVEGTISLGNRLIRAYRRMFNEVCCCILVTGDGVVPPQHEANVPVKKVG